MEHKPRITVIGQVFPIKGGISHYNSLLINELQERADVRAISFSRIFPKWLHPLATNQDVESKNFFKGSAEFIFDVPNPLSWGRVARQAVENKPDMLIFHWYTPVLAVPFWFVLSKIKKLSPQTTIIGICHNVVPHEKTPLDKIFTRLVLKKADTLVVHSKRDEDALKKWLPEASVVRLFHPVYDFSPRNISREDARKKLGVQGNVMLFFGGIRAYKGLEFLLKAVAEAKKKIPLTLVIAGEFFGNKEKYLHLIGTLGIQNEVKIFDHYISNEDIASFFEAADVVVAPYLSGTQSGAINVALAFDKPIIATDVGGFSEIVIPGKTGYLVPPGDSDALARALVTFFTTPPHDSFARYMEAIRGLHSWKNLSKRILSLISKKV